MNTISQLATLVRYYSLLATTAAGSGHPTSCLSATDIMTTLFFGGFFQADLDDPTSAVNDRLIFSKGHAAPLLYALYAAAGKVSLEELQTLRDFDSELEGHPTMRFRYSEAATGSLGQGLSIGVGMALYAKYMSESSYRTYVLLGDSEFAEGQVWEAMEIAAKYQLDNLIGILDVNRLGQRGETMYGHDTSIYKKKAEAFGWNAIVIDGHNIAACKKACKKAKKHTGKPTLIIAKTLKGKGVSFIEDKEDWHGRVLNNEEFDRAVVELGEIQTDSVGTVSLPTAKKKSISQKKKEKKEVSYKSNAIVATRDAYGDALQELASNSRIVVLDAETSNSTRADKFKTVAPDRFFEMYIAEQNMVSTAVGLSRMGAKPFVSTFAAFLTRAFDQIRMAQYSEANIVFCGSHAGVSIGADGSSQMGLEDIAMMRTVQNSLVLYPSDAWSMHACMQLAADYNGISYIRSTREKTLLLYAKETKFQIGGSQTVVGGTKKDSITIVAAGITVHEAIAAANNLQKQGIQVRVIDMYSIKPLDQEALKKASEETEAVIVVEDHYQQGGIYEAVCASGAVTVPIYSLAVTKIPRSGEPQELLAYEGIDSKAIQQKITEIISK